MYIFTMLLKLVLLAVVTSTCVACSESSKYVDDFHTNPVENSIVDREWTLIQFEKSDGITQTISDSPDFEFTIRFNNGNDKISGINVCNHYSGDFSLEESTLSVLNVEEDARACERATEQPAALFYRVLLSNSNPPILSVHNNQLFVSSGNNERLIFTDKATKGLTLLQGGDLASLGNRVSPDPRYRFFRNLQPFLDFYKSLHQYPQTMSELPQINFDETTVLYIAHEIVSSGGYSIEILSVEEIENRLTIGVQKHAPGENCVVTAAFTGPYQFYTVVGVFDQIDFVEKPIISQPCP